MGTPLSKTAGKAETAVEKPGEAAASPSKTNGQVNWYFEHQSVHIRRGLGRGGKRGAIGA